MCAPVCGFVRMYVCTTCTHLKEAADYCCCEEKKAFPRGEVLKVLEDDKKKKNEKKEGRKSVKVKKM